MKADGIATLFHRAVAVVTVGKQGSVAPEKFLTATKTIGHDFFLASISMDEINVVADRAQIGLHTEIGALESAAGGKTGCASAVPTARQAINAVRIMRLISCSSLRMPSVDSGRRSQRAQPRSKLSKWDEWVAKP
jgi:hypothetical protein